MSKFWKKIDKQEFKTMLDCVNKLKEKNYYVSPWIENIASTYVGNYEKLIYPYHLKRVYVSEIGFKKPTKLIEIYKKFGDLDFNLVDPLISIQARFYYDEQPNGEWLRFAVPFDSMIDSDGVPHLPKFGKALEKYFLETYWSYPDAIFHPHNEFVVAIK